MTLKDRFETDIEVPESVQKKADLALASIRQEADTGKRSKKKYNWAKGLVAVAAALALVFGMNKWPSLIKTNTTGSGKVAESNKAEEGPFFTLNVYAAELEEGKPFIFGGTDVNSLSMAALSRENYDMEIDLDLDFEVEGEDISTVTYSITGGLFEVVHPEGVEYVKSGVEYEDYAYGTGQDQYYDSEEDSVEQGVEEYYTSYTIDYKDQDMENIRVDAAIDSFSNQDNYKYIFLGAPNLKKTIDCLNSLFKDVTITVSVSYADGSVSSKELAFNCFYRCFEAGSKDWALELYLKGDEKLSSIEYDDDMNVIDTNMPQEELDYGTAIAESDSGIQYGSEITVSIEEENSTGGWDKLQETYTLGLIKDVTEFFEPELLGEDEYSSSGFYEEDIVNMLNQFIGLEVGDQTIVTNPNDGQNYRYTILSFQNF